MVSFLDYFNFEKEAALRVLEKEYKYKHYAYKHIVCFYPLLSGCCSATKVTIKTLHLARHYPRLREDALAGNEIPYPTR